MFKASYTVTLDNGVEFVRTIRYLDDKSKDAAIRHGRRVIKRLFPRAKVRHRGVWNFTDPWEGKS